MDYLFTGFNDIDFTDQKTGAKIDGVKIYIVYEDLSNEKLTGKIAEGKFLQRSQVNHLGVDFKDLINRRVDIITNIKGHVVNIILKEK